jgi:hypothetical protein
MKIIKIQKDNGDLMIQVWIWLKGRDKIRLKAKRIRQYTGV